MVTLRSLGNWRLAAASVPDGRFTVLDGWRGISILCVLAAHLLPLGPKSWQINATAGPLGMVLFFVLSGFLITHTLLVRPDLREFLARRLLRVVPLAWLYLALMLGFSGASPDIWFAHLFFYANLPPERLIETTAHFWSLCVEMQFYLLVALFFGLLGRKGLWLLPVLCLAVTALRIHDQALVVINTHYRADEILAGSTLALLLASRHGERLRAALARMPVLPVLVLLVISCHPHSGAFNFLRPYLGALLVGITLCQSGTLLARLLAMRPLAYLATISYTLYVIHPALAHTWLGSGETLEKYLKRPLLFAILFVLAHLSTHHYERHWIALGKRIGRRRPVRESA